MTRWRNLVNFSLYFFQSGTWGHDNLVFIWLWCSRAKWILYILICLRKRKQTVKKIFHLILYKVCKINWNPIIRNWQIYPLWFHAYYLNSPTNPIYFLYICRVKCRSFRKWMISCQSKWDYCWRKRWLMIRNFMDPIDWPGTPTGHAWINRG